MINNAYFPIIYVYICIYIVLSLYVSYKKIKWEKYWDFIYLVS